MVNQYSCFVVLQQYKDVSDKTDEEIIQMVNEKIIHSHELEKHMPNDLERAVHIRRCGNSLAAFKYNFYRLQ